MMVGSSDSLKGNLSPAVSLGEPLNDTDGTWTQEKQQMRSQLTLLNEKLNSETSTRIESQVHHILHAIRHTHTYYGEGILLLTINMCHSVVTMFTFPLIVLIFCAGKGRAFANAKQGIIISSTKVDGTTSTAPISSNESNYIIS